MMWLRLLSVALLLSLSLSLSPSAEFVMMLSAR